MTSVQSILGRKRFGDALFGHDGVKKMRLLSFPPLHEDPKIPTNECDEQRTSGSNNTATTETQVLHASMAVPVNYCSCDDSYNQNLTSKTKGKADLCYHTDKPTKMEHNGVFAWLSWFARLAVVVGTIIFLWYTTTALRCDLLHVDHQPASWFWRTGSDIPHPKVPFAGQPIVLFRGTSQQQHQHQMLGRWIDATVHEDFKVMEAISKKQHAQNTDTIPLPVEVMVCVESLCIDSQRYFHQQLMPAFQKLGPSVMNLRTVVYGNAKMNGNNVTCQHGPGECDANVYEQCAVHLYPEPIQHMPYLACLFRKLPMGHRDTPFDPSAVLEPCATQTRLDWRLIQWCHNNPKLSWNLTQQAASATPTEHTYVPWVQLDGTHLKQEDTKDLVQEVCRLYQKRGGHHPKCIPVTGKTVTNAALIL